MPDTLLSISIDDSPTNNTFTFSRRANESPEDNYWLMPHYSFWSWAMPYIGPLDEAMTKISQIEQATPFPKKINKVIWRGTRNFNPVFNTELRPNLLRVSGGKPWSDIEAFQQGDRRTENNNIKSIEEFCRYKYIAYTEVGGHHLFTWSYLTCWLQGKTYSGRLAYHQACASVVLTPPFLFMQHLSHLVRPLYASTLSTSSKPGLVHKPPGSSLAFPTSYPPETANMIFVDNDWSNLESTITWLDGHPEITERIARNQRDMMVGQGYLSPAAEACYWRALITGWAKKARPREAGHKAWGQWQTEGMRWETFSVHGRLDWS